MTDLLREASHALREFGGAGKDSSAMTRARVLASLQRKKKTSRRRSLVAIPLAALLMGSLALAATGGRLPAPVQKWLSSFTAKERNEQAPPERQFPRRAPALPEVRADSGNAPALATGEPAEHPLAPREQAQTKDAGAGVLGGVAGHVRDVPAARATPEEKPMTEEEYERYRTAHQAHFVDRDPAAALAAWSEYLAHSPSGRLAVEARYNRALCLLKLGRNQEAITALRPFTQGSYGAYRQKEALRLIAQLEIDAGAQHSVEGRN